MLTSHLTRHSPICFKCVGISTEINHWRSLRWQRAGALMGSLRQGRGCLTTNAATLHVMAWANEKSTRSRPTLRICQVSSTGVSAWPHPALAAASTSRS
jgi:hypothetical protein